MSDLAAKVEHTAWASDHDLDPSQFILGTNLNGEPLFNIRRATVQEVYAQCRDLYNRIVLTTPAGVKLYWYMADYNPKE